MFTFTKYLEKKVRIERNSVILNLLISTKIFLSNSVPTEKYTVAGWGRTVSDDVNNAEGFEDSAAYESQLQKLQLDEYISGEVCAEKFKGYGKLGVSQKQVCARAEYEESKLFSKDCLYFKHYTNFLCLLVIDNPKDACSGDSGGPLFASSGLNNQSDLKYLVGIFRLVQLVSVFQ